MLNKKNYDCLNCPGYCCSYARIAVSKKDIKRLAKFFEMNFVKAKKKFTKSYKFKNENNKTINEIILRHRNDSIFKSTCQFLDKKSRSCNVYEARPDVCREYPDSKRCGYYEFLKFERKQQEDKSYVPTC
tara:strand:- start:32 stop:421 length:390 start_codon:yes stop_codon:yes gene_type:complete